MSDRTNRRILEQLAGHGWLLREGARLCQVTYEVDIIEVRTSGGALAVPGTETHVRLRNHSINPQRHGARSITLCVQDGRCVTGFLSADGMQLTRTGTLV